MSRRGSRAAAATAAAVVGALGLTACAASPSSPALQTPIPLESAWRPGFLVEGHGPVGLAPVVTSSTTASARPTASASASGSVAAASPSASASPSPSDTTLQDAVQQQLATVGLLTSDFAKGLTVSLATDGTSLAKPSLSYCAAAYPSEKARQARRRVSVDLGAGAQYTLASESVLYAAPSDAAAALAELRAADKACPDTRTAVVSGTTLTVTKHATSDVDVTGLVPQADRVVISTDVDDPAHKAKYRVVGIYQVRGRVLVGLLFSSQGTDFTTADLKALHDLATGTATRLDRLDSGFVGTG